MSAVCSVALLGVGSAEAAVLPLFPTTSSSSSSSAAPLSRLSASSSPSSTGWSTSVRRRTDLTWPVQPNRPARLTREERRAARILKRGGLAGSSSSSSAPAPAVDPLLLSRQNVLALTNDERRINGLPQLQNDDALDALAQSYAEEMLAGGFFGHTTPDGRTFGARFEAINYVATIPRCECRRTLSSGENIAKGQTSAEEVVQDWILSPPHHENIVKPIFTRLGVGRAGDVWVQIFAGWIDE